MRESAAYSVLRMSETTASRTRPRRHCCHWSRAETAVNHQRQSERGLVCRWITACLLFHAPISHLFPFSSSANVFPNFAVARNNEHMFSEVKRGWHQRQSSLRHLTHSSSFANNLEEQRFKPPRIAAKFSLVRPASQSGISCLLRQKLTEVPASLPITTPRHGTS